MTKFKTLETQFISPENTQLKSQRLPELVHLNDPAFMIMIDFSQFPAFKIKQDATLEDAQHEMEFHGTHFMLVHNPDCQLVGVLTASDLLGAKPIKVSSDLRIAHDDIPVQHLMTSLNKIPTLSIEIIEYARVGHIIKTLHTVDAPFALVTQPQTDGKESIRGYFTTSQISKQLHHNIRRGAVDIDKFLDEHH